MSIKLFIEQLERAVEQDTIKVKRSGPLSLYKYNSPNGPWDSVHKEARGIIIDSDKQRIIARGFKKFFNLNENDESVIQKIKNKYVNSQYDTLEKLDGSCILLWNYDRFWHLSTLGDFDNIHTKEASSILTNFDCFDPSFTYIFELISPKFRQEHIVNYRGRRELVLLGIRHNEKGFEYDESFLDGFAARNGLSRPRRYSNVDMYNPSFEPNTEGYVIRFYDGYRLKIKASEYVLAHKTLGSLYNRDFLLSLFDSDVSLKYKDFDLDFDDIKARLMTMRNSLSERISNWHKESLKYNSRKDQALWITRNVPKIYSGFVFGLLDGKDMMQKLNKVVVEEFLSSVLV